MKFCKLDIRKATIDTILQQTIENAIVDNVKNRYSYELIDENYTIEIIPNKKIVNNYAANKVANSLTKRINQYKPNILRVIKKQIDEYSPIQLEVFVNPEFINYKFEQLPVEQQNNIEVNLDNDQRVFQRDLSYFNGDEALYEQEESELEKFFIDNVDDIENGNIIIIC